MTSPEEFRTELDEVKRAQLALAKTVADLTATVTDRSRREVQLAETVARLSRAAANQAEVLARLAGPSG